MQRLQRRREYFAELDLRYTRGNRCLSRARPAGEQERARRRRAAVRWHGGAGEPFIDLIEHPAPPREILRALVDDLREVGLVHRALLSRLSSA